MTKKETKTHKIVYSWQKIPYNAVENATIADKVSLGALKSIQFVAYEGITEALARAHGYRVKELYKEFSKDQPISIYIAGSLKECEQHLKDLNKQSFSELKSKITGHKLLRLVSKKQRQQVLTEGSNSFEDLQNKLLGCGVLLDVTIEKV